MPKNPSIGSICRQHSSLENSQHIMPPCGRGMHGSRSKGRGQYSRVTHNVANFVSTFRHKIPAKIQEEIFDMEANTKVEQAYT